MYETPPHNSCTAAMCKCLLKCSKNHNGQYIWINDDEITILCSYKKMICFYGINK